jgi:hypothetical protein
VRARTPVLFATLAVGLLALGGCTPSWYRVSGKAPAAVQLRIYDGTTEAERDMFGTYWLAQRPSPAGTNDATAKPYTARVYVTDDQGRDVREYDPVQDFDWWRDAADMVDLTSTQDDSKTGQLFWAPKVGPATLRATVRHGGGVQGEVKLRVYEGSKPEADKPAALRVQLRDASTDALVLTPTAGQTYKIRVSGLNAQGAEIGVASDARLWSASAGTPSVAKLATVSGDGAPRLECVADGYCRLEVRVPSASVTGSLDVFVGPRPRVRVEVLDSSGARTAAPRQGETYRLRIVCVGQAGEEIPQLADLSRWTVVSSAPQLGKVTRATATAPATVECLAKGRATVTVIAEDLGLEGAADLYIGPPDALLVEVIEAVSGAPAGPTLHVNHPYGLRVSSRYGADLILESALHPSRWSAESAAPTIVRVDRDANKLVSGLTALHAGGATAVTVYVPGLGLSGQAVVTVADP